MVLHTKALSEQTFNEDQILIDAMMFRFIQISEYIKRVSETFKSKHTDIPWMSINGLRNRIVHDYGNVDVTIVYQAVKQDLPILEETFKKLIVEISAG